MWIWCQELSLLLTYLRYLNLLTSPNYIVTRGMWWWRLSLRSLQLKELSFCGLEVTNRVDTIQALGFQIETLAYRNRTVVRKKIQPINQMPSFPQFRRSIYAYIDTRDSFHSTFIHHSASHKKNNSMASVRKRTIPTERPPLVSEVSDLRYL
jgi:hypothetical protein